MCHASKSERFRRIGKGFTLPLLLVLIGAATTTTAPDTFSAPFPPVSSFAVGTIHVDEYGSGTRTLVLIPGLASGPWVWYGTIAQFAPHFHIYAITLPGFDGRAATEKKPLFAAVAVDFWRMLEDHKIERPIVVGHSLGGTLAIALAEEHPERLSGIVAVDGLPVFPLLANAGADDRKAMAAAMAGGYASFTQADEFVSGQQFMSTIGTNRPEMVDVVARLEARSNPKAVGAWLAEDLSGDWRPQLTKITIPFLEIMPYDPADGTPPMGSTREQKVAFYQALIAGAPRGKVVAVAPSRHFVMLDQPAAFYDALNHFFSSISK